MPTPSAHDDLYKSFLENLLQFTQNYWSFARNSKPSPVINVPWNMEVLYPRPLMLVERQALECLKRFETLFVKHKHIESDKIARFSALAQNTRFGYEEKVLINYEIEECSSEERLKSRHYQFDFELDHCLISYFNKDYVPCINLVALSSRGPLLIP